MPQPKRPRDEGASLLETAIIVPLLLLILAGVVDVGRAFHTYIAMLNAAREGARVGVNSPWNTGLICATVVNEASTSGVDLSTASCSVSQSGSGNPVRVTVQMNFPLVMGDLIGSGSIPLQTTAVFRAR
jgi:Flp pilus assembly protein TadG